MGRHVYRCIVYFCMMTYKYKNLVQYTFQTTYNRFILKKNVNWLLYADLFNTFSTYSPLYECTISFITGKHCIYSLDTKWAIKQNSVVRRVQFEN